MAASDPRVGTCYHDPVTGEHVMPPDFEGDVELRWPCDCPPELSGTVNSPDDQSPVREDNRHDAESGAVPICEQLANYDEYAARACAELAFYLLSEEGQEAVIALGRERGAGIGWRDYGDRLCHEPLCGVRQMYLEELADAAWYKAEELRRG